MNQIRVLKIRYVLLLLFEMFKILYFIRADPMVPSVTRGWLIPWTLRSLTVQVVSLLSSHHTLPTSTSLPLTRSFHSLLGLSPSSSAYSPTFTSTSTSLLSLLLLSHTSSYRRGEEEEEDGKEGRREAEEEYGWVEVENMKECLVIHPHWSNWQFRGARVDSLNLCIECGTGSAGCAS